MTDTFLRDMERTGATIQANDTDMPSIRPETVEVLSDVIKTAATHREPLMIAGGMTLPFIAAGQSSVLLDVTGIDNGLTFSPDDLFVECSGAVLYDILADEADKLGFTVPAWGGFAPGQTCAGAWMSGSLGPWGVHHDELHRSVIGVTGVDAGGRIVRFGGRTAKNVTGYDMTWFLGGTLGLFLVATTIIVKIQPAPQDRKVLSASFRNVGDCVSFMRNAGQSEHRIVRSDLWGDQGVSRQLTVSMAVEGMKSIVESELSALKAMAEMNGASEIGILAVDDWIVERRRILGGMSLFGMIQVTVPASAATGFLEHVKRIAPDVPVWGSPLTGSYFLASRNDMTDSDIENAARSLGGKNPISLSQVLEGYLGGLFTPAEKKIITSLKRELDPGNIFNPHLRIS